MPIRANCAWRGTRSSTRTCGSTSSIAITRLRELIALEKEIGRPLDAMRLLFRQNRVVSSIVGDFDHKSAFEILTDPELSEQYFGADDRRLFRRHVLWTRLLGIAAQHCRTTRKATCSNMRAATASYWS